MTRFLVVVSALLAVTVAAAAASAAGPPVIREPFTPLPCPSHPATTVALEGCGERALLRGDARINARVRTIYERLRPGSRLTFVRSEVAWLRYRRLSCQAETSTAIGGSVQPVLFVDCEVRRNAMHFKELGAILRALETH